MQRYLFGPSTQQIKETILNSPNDIVNIDFGKAFGTVCFIKPRDCVNLPDLLNLLDTLPEGRRAMAPVDYVLDGPSLLARTDEHGLQNHRIFMTSLTRPTDYIRFTLDAAKKHFASSTEFSLKELVSAPIRQALTRGLFDLDEQSTSFADALEALSRANIESDKDLAQEIREILIGIHYPKAFAFVLSYMAKKAREQYLANVQSFLDSQSEKIAGDLHDYSVGKPITNVISRSIIDLLKTKHPELENRDKMNAALAVVDNEIVTEFLRDKYIKTLPGMMVAGDSIMAVVTSAITALASNPTLLTKVRENIENTQFFASGNPVEMQKIIDTDKRNGGLLHRIFLESLRMRSLHEKPEHKRFNGLTWRYTQAEIKNGVDVIPANSLIAIMNSYDLFDESRWEQAGTFKPSRFKNKSTGELDKERVQSALNLFSQGNRMCPAHKISEYLIKVYFAYIVKHFDFTIEKSITNDKRENFRVKLSAREDQPVNEKGSVIHTQSL